MNKKRVTLPLLCLFLLGFTGVVHGAYTILDQSFTLSPPVPYLEFPFDLSAGDSITISVAASSAINFRINGETGEVYSKPNIFSLNDVWTVPAEGNYKFRYEFIAEMATVDTVIGSEVIPEFQTWTSILLILIVLSVSLVLYKRRISNH